MAAADKGLAGNGGWRGVFLISRQSFFGGFFEKKEILYQHAEFGERFYIDGNYVPGTVHTVYEGAGNSLLLSSARALAFFAHNRQTMDECMGESSER
jgi:hypothetical protein